MTRSVSILVAVAYIVIAAALVEVEPEVEPEVEEHSNKHTAFDHYDFMKDHSLVTCVPPKTGTTSFYRYVYRGVFGKPWPYHDAPWASDIYSERWNNTFTRLEKVDILFSAARQKIAVVRDPIERMLSGWRTKLACKNMDEDVDRNDQQRLVKHIYDLAGVKFSGRHCLTFKKYVDYLKIIHEKGNAHLLDQHFVPQQYGCFDRVPAEQWDLVAPISSLALRNYLARMFGTPYLEMPQKHSSGKSFWVEIPGKTRYILNNITQAEYAALGNYLGKGHAAHVQGSASRECDNEACGIPCNRHDGACLTW